MHTEDTGLCEFATHVGLLISALLDSRLALTAISPKAAAPRLCLAPFPQDLHEARQPPSFLPKTSSLWAEASLTDRLSPSPGLGTGVLRVQSWGRLPTHFKGLLLPEESSQTCLCPSTAPLCPHPLPGPLGHRAEPFLPGSSRPCGRHGNTSPAKAWLHELPCESTSPRWTTATFIRAEVKSHPFFLIST